MYCILSEAVLGIFLLVFVAQIVTNLSLDNCFCFSLTCLEEWIADNVLNDFQDDFVVDISAADKEGLVVL